MDMDTEGQLGNPSEWLSRAYSDLGSSQKAIEKLKPTGSPVVTRILERYAAIFSDLRTVRDQVALRTIGANSADIQSVLSNLRDLEESLQDAMTRGNGVEGWRDWINSALLCAHSALTLVQITQSIIDRVVASSTPRAE